MPVLTVRNDGSHTVASAVELVPSGHVLNFRRQYGYGFFCGMGPRELPSHASHPTEQPFENQKHACPFLPEGAPSSPGTGHQPVFVSTDGGCAGTGPLHGRRSLSTAFLGAGFVTAPCPATMGSRAMGSRAMGSRALIASSVLSLRAPDL